MRTTDSIQPLGANTHTRTHAHARGQRTRGLSKLLEAGLRYQVPLRSQKLPLRAISPVQAWVSAALQIVGTLLIASAYTFSLSFRPMLLLWSNRPETRGSLSLSLSRYLLQATDDVASPLSQKRCARRTRKAARTSQHTAARGLPRGPRKAKSALFSRRACPCYGMAANTKVWRTNFGGPLASYEAEHTCAHTDQLCEEAMPMLGAD